MNKKNIKGIVLAIAAAATITLFPVVSSADQQTANQPMATDQTATPTSTTAEPSATQPAANQPMASEQTTSGNATKGKVHHGKMHHGNRHHGGVKCVVKSCKGMRVCHTDSVSGHHLHWIHAESKAACDKMRGSKHMHSMHRMH